ncbi:shikimate kinase AroK [Candidatus Erwinia haradaeae]|uniref:Shikimate kinase 1 n=1 Tax=Candidatus Erwinia haradaeae TaxID=1922217 RepID=A0A451DP84_9GAMM|nr:shikimate kinase AroK [Candidatus Erwinia haradaeae]VFP88605.1 Shikimate kinase 1 [Candidatus Erwinia haradaeae]
MTKKHNIFLVGPAGSGKSTIGRNLSQLLQMEFFDSDYEIERRSGVNIDWIIDVEGEIGFRTREEKIIAELTKKRGIVLAAGTSCIQSQNTCTHLSTRGMVIHLEITTLSKLERTYHNKKYPLPITTSYFKMTTQALLDAQNLLYKEISDVTIHTNKQSPRLIVKKILQILKTNISN